MPDDIPSGAPPETAAAAAPPASASEGPPTATDERFNDPEIAKHISDKVAAQLRHIPTEHRSPEAYRRLMTNSQQFDQMQRDPGWLAYQAGRNGRGQQQQAQERKFREILAERMSARWGDLGDRGPFLGDMFEAFEGYLKDNVLPGWAKENVQPWQHAYLSDKVRTEYDAAAKLKGFKEHEAEIRNLIEQRPDIPWHWAYRIVTHGVPVEAAVAAAAMEAEGMEGEKRAAQSEKPTGQGSKDVETKRPTTRAEAKKVRDLRLRAKGII